MTLRLTPRATRCLHGAQESLSASHLAGTLAGLDATELAVLRNSLGAHPGKLSRRHPSPVWKPAVAVTKTPRVGRPCDQDVPHAACDIVNQAQSLSIEARKSMKYLGYSSSSSRGAWAEAVFSSKRKRKSPPTQGGRRPPPRRSPTAPSKRWSPPTAGRQQPRRGHQVPGQRHHQKPSLYRRECRGEARRSALRSLIPWTYSACWTPPRPSSMPTKARLSGGQAELANLQNVLGDHPRAGRGRARFRRKAQAADAHAKAERTQQLFDAKPTALASQEDLDTANTTAAQMDASVENAKAAIAELDQQKISIETKKTGDQRQDKPPWPRINPVPIPPSRTSTTAPSPPPLMPADRKVDPPRWFISALLTNIAPGYIVQSGTSGFSAGTTIMTLSDLSHVFVLASVDESDIGNVIDPVRGGEKQKVRVTVDSFPGQVFDGQVVRVATKGVNTSNVVTFEVKIEVTSDNRTLLRPEMTGTANIVCAARHRRPGHSRLRFLPLPPITAPSPGKNSSPPPLPAIRRSSWPPIRPPSPGLRSGDPPRRPWWESQRRPARSWGAPEWHRLRPQGRWHHRGPPRRRWPFGLRPCRHPLRRPLRSHQRPQRRRKRPPQQERFRFQVEEQRPQRPAGHETYGWRPRPLIGDRA